ncbi:MAG: Gfo/Idh/MocA family oxidoreductase [Victivallales bacterium]|nr:Gfo/Idh/MocA family oxidoreductase [Victivallales bacterium]
MMKVCIIHETGNKRLGGHFIENSFTGLPGVNIAAYADSNREREDKDRVSGAARSYYDYREMVERENPDILLLSSRLPEEHFEQINFAIDYNCHVLTEKPFVANLVQGDCLIRRAREKNIKIAVAHLARYAPVFIKMKEMIEGGEIGQVLNCYLRGKEDNRGGGEDMMVLGSHLLDLAVYLLGKPTEVYADIRTKGKVITSEMTMPTDEPIGPTAGDEIIAFYRFPKGVNTIFESRRGMVARNVCTRMGIVVCGTKGTLAVRFDGNRELRLCRKFPMPFEDEASFIPVPVPVPPEIPDAMPLNYAECVQNPDNPTHRYYADNNRRAAWDLLQAVKNNTSLRSSCEDALWSTEMIVGAYRSGIERRAITIPLLCREHPLQV